MKVKILIVPLVLVASLAFMIWLVYPAYSDMRIQQGELKKQNSQVADLEGKDQKVKELTSVLNGNVEKQAIVIKFLPSSQKEEEIIKSLNEIASQEGVSVSGISVSEPKTETAPLEIVPPTSYVPSASSVSAVDNGTDQLLASNPAPARSKTIKFETELNLYGSYDKIKNVINKIYNLNRSNQVTNLTISHSGGGGEKEIADNLQADLTLEFSYLEMGKIESVVDMNNKILASGKFDMAVADEIQRIKNTDVSSVNLDSSGKTNPFLP